METACQEIEDGGEKGSADLRRKILRGNQCVSLSSKTESPELIVGEAFVKSQLYLEDEVFSQTK